MTFTTVPVSGTYLDGATPRTGTVRLQLTGPMVNAGEIADCQPVTLTLDSAGKVAATWRATNDPDTSPATGTALRVTETISGLPVTSYVIAVPYDGGPIDLQSAPHLTAEEIPAPIKLVQTVNERGRPGGYATLDDGGRVPHDQLPPDLGGGGGGGVSLSGTATDIQPLGVRAAGTSGLAADASHVHPLPTLNEVGAPSADVDMGNQRITDLKDGEGPQDAVTVAQLGRSLQSMTNVKDAAYGAKGDNVTDDTTALQAALDAAGPGGVVYLPAGRYRTSAPLVVPPGVTVRGAHASLMSGVGLTDVPCYIQPLVSFVGTSLLVLKDQAAGGYASTPAEHRIESLLLDGSTLDGTTPVDGIYASGNVTNVRLDGVTIRKMSNNGIATGAVSNVYPYSWRLHRVTIDNCRANGMIVTRMTDLTMVDCEAIGNWASGFKFTDLANSTLLGCRAEWNGNHGFHFTGAWGNGAGSGGAVVSACSTDRNGWHGVLVDATGNGPLTIADLTTRRDGRNGGSGGGSYAGLALVGSTLPVVGHGITCYPGVDDDGTGTSSPQYGARLSGTASNVQLDVLYLHGATQGLFDDGTNTAITIGTTVTTATGPTTAPVRAVRPAYSVDWLNVKQFGAKGDGTTDDTTAVQAAVNASNTAGGGTVYLPPGRYILSAALAWASGVNLRGAGDRVSILHQSSTTADAISGTDLASITLEAVQLSGPGKGSGTGVQFSRFSAPATAQITLRDVFIQSFGGDGLFLHETAAATLQRVRVRNCGGVGIHLQAPQDTVLGGASTSLTACSSEGCVVGGFWLDGMAYSSLNACAVQGSPAGYRLDACRGISITASGAEQCTTGLIIYGGSGTAVHGFTTKGSDGTSVWVTNGATGILLGAVVELAPVAAATACLRTDTGTVVTALSLAASPKPNVLSGTVNRIDPGDGSVVLAGRTVVPSDRMGTAVLVGGTVLVAAPAVGASSVVQLTIQVPGGTPGTPMVSARTAGTSFTITSTSASDTSTVGWRILDPS